MTLATCFVLVPRDLTGSFFLINVINDTENTIEVVMRPGINIGSAPMNPINLYSEPMQTTDNPKLNIIAIMI